MSNIEGGVDNQVEQRQPRARWGLRAILPTLLVLAALALWVLLYLHLNEFALWYVYDVLKYPGRPENSSAMSDCCIPAVTEGGGIVREGRTVAFLLFQLPHVFLLLTGVVFVMGVVRSFFSPERTRRLLLGRNTLGGNALAAGLGVLTPFCSCSAVPLFIGFVTAGVPLGSTFTFLTAAPLVNEIALVLLWSTFGPKIALLYLVIGLTIALLTGLIIGRLKMERHIEEWVLQLTAGEAQTEDAPLTWNGRLRAGLAAVGEILGRVWLYVLAGILVGAVIHVFVSPDALAALLGERRWWSVPLAVAVGVPVYASPAGIIPVAEVLMGKGVPLGTVLAFMMAVIGLSLPEFIILRRVLKPRLILLFAGVVALGILIVGFVFNLVM
ncbi:MAG: permease [Armatimonadota bacterium]